MFSGCFLFYSRSPDSYPTSSSLSSSPFVFPFPLHFPSSSSSFPSFQIKFVCFLTLLFFFFLILYLLMLIIIHIILVIPILIFLSPAILPPPLPLPSPSSLPAHLAGIWSHFISHLISISIWCEFSKYLVWIYLQYNLNTEQKNTNTSVPRTAIYNVNRCVHHFSLTNNIIWMLVFTAWRRQLLGY